MYINSNDKADTLRRNMKENESMKKWIIECLQERGGSAWPREVSKYVWDSYEAELRDFGDMLYTWQYDIR